MKMAGAATIDGMADTTTSTMAMMTAMYVTTGEPGTEGGNLGHIGASGKLSVWQQFGHRLQLPKQCSASLGDYSTIRPASTHSLTKDGYMRAQAQIISRTCRMSAWIHTYEYRWTLLVEMCVAPAGCQQHFH